MNSLINRSLLATLITIVLVSCTLISSAQDAAFSNKDVISMKSAKISDDLILSKIATGKCSFDMTTQGLIALKDSKISEKIVKAMLNASPSAEMITNDDIIKLTGANISDNIILAKIAGTKCNFDLTSQGLITLKNSKISEKIVKTMLNATPSTETLTNDDIIKLTTAKLSTDIIKTKIQITAHDFDLSADGMIKLNNNAVDKNIVKMMMGNPKSTSVNNGNQSVVNNDNPKSDRKQNENTKMEADSTNATETLDNKDLANLGGSSWSNKYYRTYISQDGSKYSIGDKITLKFPTNNGKTFNYAFSQALLSSKYDQLPATFSNKTYEIKVIYVKNMGYGKNAVKTVYFKTKNVGGLGNYIIIEIENALSSKEVKSNTITEEEAIAEIKKAKDKLELGLITQKEFDTIKQSMIKYIKH